jgi:NifU-like domain
MNAPSSWLFSFRHSMPKSNTMRDHVVNCFMAALAFSIVPQGSSSFIVPSSSSRGFTCQHSSSSSSRALGGLQSTEQQIVSPFDESKESTLNEDKSATKLGYNLDLTLENVEAVLDELRPYLIQDGGNVVVTEIDGPVVKLELQVGGDSTRRRVVALCVASCVFCC